MSGGGDSGGALVGLAAAIFIIYVVLQIVAFLLTLGILIALIVLGFVSFFMAKSGKALVRQSSAMAALYGALAWAGALSVGLMLGSLGLIVALPYVLGPEFEASVMARYGEPNGPNGLVLFLFDWVIVDTYTFFAKVLLVLYFANRVFLARARGGWHWLGVAPPAFAFLVFFLAEHLDAALKYMQSFSVEDLRALAILALKEVMVPFDLIVTAIDDPARVLAWTREQLIASEGSFFKLGTFFPSLFSIIAVLIAARLLITGSDGVASS